VVQTTGTINPLTTVPVGSYVSGTVQYVFADFNSRVEAGQVLAQLDPEVYQAQVVQARGNLENAIANEKNLEATIDAQEAGIKNNEANLERLKAADVYSRANSRRIIDLADQGVFSKDQADQAQSGLDQSQDASAGRRSTTQPVHRATGGNAGPGGSGESSNQNRAGHAGTGGGKSSVLHNCVADRRPSGGQ
jgi:multidrug resistance efflux pump